MHIPTPNDPDAAGFLGLGFRVYDSDQLVQFLAVVFSEIKAMLVHPFHKVLKFPFADMVLVADGAQFLKRLVNLRTIDGRSQVGN